ncbi:MAG: ribosomal L7Ae/L30e/S12e/Gadd45 family protein [Lachnospiraceae bacterium]|nr:ribosomal L7Ae/L30e/S12e/Gadd45 family protein [Lachnospiraceae bacterium]
MKQNKIYSLLGLAMRGRNMVSGEFATESAVKDGSAFVVIVASDASENTKKLFSNKCSFYEVPCFVYGTKEELGHALGKELRSSLAITDLGLAQAVIGQLEESEKLGGSKRGEN